MQMLREPQVRNAFGWKSPTSTRNAVLAGLLPKPVKVSERCWGLPSTEIEAILKAKVAGQNDEQIKALVKKLEADRTTAFEGLTP